MNTHDQGMTSDMMDTPSEQPVKSRKGFASMDEERQREIASQGGKAAHEQGKAHEWNSAEAAEAGRKGGQNSHGGGRPAASPATNAYEFDNE